MKIVLFGEYGVGKTCLINKLNTGEYTNNAAPTIGASYATWETIIDNKQMKFDIWDTAGQERFHGLLPMYLRNATVVLYCWDFTIPFDSAKASSMYKKCIKESPDCQFYLVITKSDCYVPSLTDGLANGLNCKCPEAESWVNTIDAKGCFYTSAKTGNGVSELFTSMARNVLNSTLPKTPNCKSLVITDTNTINLQTNDKKCC